MLKHGKETKDGKKLPRKKRRAIKYKIETQSKRKSVSYITVTALH